MKKAFSAGFLILLATLNTYSQVKIGNNQATINPNSLLELESTDKGLLLPRIALTATNAFAPLYAHVEGMVVYNTATAGSGTTAVTPGYYYNDGTKWLRLVTPNTCWNVTGNNGTIDSINFIGTKDNIPLNFRTNNVPSGKIDHKVFNCFLGYGAGSKNTTGNRNVAMGDSALFANTTGNYNTAIGCGTLTNSTTSYNTLFGCFAGGASNALYTTAFGHSALYNNLGKYNTAVGLNSLMANTTGINNTALGYRSIENNTTGDRNVCIGSNAMTYNTTGNYNIGIGVFALNSNVSSNNNTCIGFQSLLETTGAGNTALGFNTGLINITGSNNTLIGSMSDVSSAALTNATAIGYNAKVSQNSSLVLGGIGVDAVKVGIGTTAPVNSMDIIGSLGTNIRSVTASTTTNTTDHTIICKGATGGTISLEAPSAANKGRIVFIKDASSTGFNMLGHINGTAATTVTGAAGTNSAIFQCDGTTWWR